MLIQHLIRAMAHHVYTTPGFIVSSSVSGEANKFFYIFTRDLGMVGAAAQGVRLGKSKLRYHAQDFAQGTFSLVRGKEVWRLTGAAADSIDLYDDAYELYIKLLTLLKRLLKGEESHPELFDTIRSTVDFLSTRKTVDMKMVEYLAVLRILYHLGYISRTVELEPFLQTNDWSEQLLLDIEKIKSSALRAINNGLKESQL